VCRARAVYVRAADLEVSVFVSCDTHWTGSKAPLYYATRSQPCGLRTTLVRQRTRLKNQGHEHVARVALARKLLIAVYALLHEGEVFDEAKFAAR